MKWEKGILLFLLGISLSGLVIFIIKLSSSSIVFDGVIVNTQQQLVIPRSGLPAYTNLVLKLKDEGVLLSNGERVHPLGIRIFLVTDRPMVECPQSDDLGLVHGLGLGWIEETKTLLVRIYSRDSYLPDTTSYIAACLTQAQNQPLVPLKSANTLPGWTRYLLRMNAIKIADEK